MLPSDLLAKGWIQGRASNTARTKFCIIGAVDYCFYRAGSSFPNGDQNLYPTLIKEVEATGWGKGVPGWNDKIGRTQAKVVALVRRAEIACGLRPEDNPEQWDIPVQPIEEPKVEAEPVLAKTV